MKNNKKILILHGWGGSDFPHWQSWLAGELAKDYGCVNFFKFTNPDTPELGIWKKELLEQLQEFKPDIVICHSLANTLWFHICNDNDVQIEPVEKLFLVAPPSLKCKIDELKSFFPLQLPTNLDAKETLLVASSNDPYISLDEIKTIQEKLAINTKILNDAGHINSDSGYGEWRWILEEVIR